MGGGYAVDMCLNRGDRAVSWSDVSGWDRVICIIRDIVGVGSQNAAPMSCVRLGCKVSGVPS